MIREPRGRPVSRIRVVETTPTEWLFPGHWRHGWQEWTATCPDCAVRVALSAPAADVGSAQAEALTQAVVNALQTHVAEAHAEADEEAYCPACEAAVTAFTTTDDPVPICAGPEITVPRRDYFLHPCGHPWLPNAAGVLTLPLRPIGAPR